MKKILFFLGFILLVSMANAQSADSTMQQYTGKYKFPDGSPVTEITVAVENGMLVANSAMGSSELRKTEGDTFEIVAYNGTAIFRRNTETKITGLNIVVGDVNIEGTKTELYFVSFIKTVF